MDDGPGREAHTSPVLRVDGK